jgi:simple sugar transport system ATP-binding protein
LPGNQQQPVVEMRSINKRFLGVTANQDIDFRLYPGEICALLGENGAGKTTLMNILFGYYTADSGEIFIKGKKSNLSSPRDAISRGIGMIHQHFTLVPSQTALENVIVATESSKGIFLDLKSSKQRLLDLQHRFGLHVDPEARVWTLSVGEQQKVEILKALYRGVDILIMDEPTAVLAPAEIEDLFKTLRTFVGEGRSAVFISHKLKEVMTISDRIVVLRDGRVVAERKTEQTNTRALVNFMVGRDLLERIEKKRISPGSPVLEIQNLTVLNDKGLEALRSLNLAVREREILGVAGVSGNGQRELSEVLFGLRLPVQGNLWIGGQALACGDPALSIRLGMARIPEDRIETGLMVDLSVEENLILERHRNPEFQTRGLLNFQQIHRFTDQLIDRYSILTPGRDAAAKSLSGGNLQKLILARELTGGAKLVVAAQPTRGLDVGAMEYIHQRLLEERAKGAGVLVISEDLDEILTISDRIVVFYEGEIVGEVPVEEASREQIGLWMTGVRT